jgi:hypothetical protein
MVFVTNWNFLFCMPQDFFFDGRLLKVSGPGFTVGSLADIVTWFGSWHVMFFAFK